MNPAESREKKSTAFLRCFLLALNLVFVLNLSFSDDLQ